jgi:uncharacterized ferritin-like protein (DUF455 family)
MSVNSSHSPDWAPFITSDPGAHADAPRSIDTPAGIGDRLRAAAFAEIQARDAFNWAADHLADAPEPLRQAWRDLARAEDRHLGWLLTRMKDLQIEVAERKVSDQLWRSLVACKTAQEFAIYMANAEERGRKAGVRFHQALLKTDPMSAKIFGTIAEEEVEHIALARRFFPEAWPEARPEASSQDSPLRFKPA